MDKENVVHIQWNTSQPEKKNEIMLFAAPWMDLEIIILNKISQRQIQVYYDIIYMWNLKKKKIQMNLFTKQKETHKHKK